MKLSLLFLALLVTLQAPESASQGLFQRVARFASGKKGKTEGLLDGIPTATLANGVQIPLVGLGVGNMLAEVIPAMVSHAVRQNKKTQLIDTSSVSNNEHLVAKGIVEGAEIVAKTSGDEGKKLEVHVITKVWYTHLGYERTMLAVNASIEKLKDALEHPNVDLQVHVMIHWPRCFDAIPWMNCEQEENDLPPEVQQVGPPPHLDKVNAWKGSWKALEKLYKDKSSPVASIGVSNFHLKELEALSGMASVKPHMVETNMWSLLYDPLMVDYCHKNNIHLTAFHLMEGILRKAEDAAFAYHHLLTVANDLTKTMQTSGALPADQELTAPQVVLAWLVQHSISVIPRTTNLKHLIENSAESLSKIPSLSDDQVQTVATSVEALISGDDLDEDAFVKLTFHAKSKDIYLYWHDEEFGGEIQVALIEKGKTFEESSHPGHTFRVYDSEDKSNFELYTVDGRYGDHNHVEL
jgi:diketogulonate reductase-like aldo/keto reductase